MITIILYVVFGLILSTITLVQEVMGERRARKNHYEWHLHMYEKHYSDKFPTLEDYMNDDCCGKFYSPNHQLEQFNFQKSNWLSSLFVGIWILLFGTFTWPLWVIAIYIKGGHNII